MFLHKTLFLSDIHLAADTPDLFEKFSKFIKRIDQTVHAIYILGDLFDTWIGDDELTGFHQEVIKLLQQITKSCPVYFLPGNRDFLIGKRFIQQSGVQFLPDETKILLYNTPILLMHGDTLCTKDVRYLKARRVLRHPLFKRFFLSLPLILRQKFAKSLRKKSLRHTKTVLPEIMDVEQKSVECKLLQHKVAYLIHGHTHKPAYHEFILDKQIRSRYVLGAWHDPSPAILSWSEDGTKYFIPF